MCCLITWTKKRKIFLLFTLILTALGIVTLIFHYKVESLPLIIVIFGYIAATFWGAIFGLMFSFVLFLIFVIVCKGLYYNIGESRSASRNSSIENQQTPQNPEPESVEFDLDNLKVDLSVATV